MSFINISPKVKKALDSHSAIVALESAVITHGLPRPMNHKVAVEVERVITDAEVVPATICIANGQIQVGLTANELKMLANETKVRKVSTKDFGIALAKQMYGGTTVAGTIAVASQVGIQVFSTGGIGGVHQGSNFDVSADLYCLAHTPMLVVCSGAKSILDLPATIEVLESYGIPIIGYQTQDFPAFYSIQSGLNVDERVDSPQEIVSIARAHWQAGNQSAVLITVPPPASSAIDYLEMQSYLKTALQDASQKGIHGPATTPFLLQRLSELSNGLSLQANRDLLIHNAEVAAEIAKMLAIIKD
jgi:pseudouridine-5'-phosphate glycosidase